MIGLSRSGADVWARDGLLPVAEMRGNRRLFRRADVERLAEERVRRLVDEAAVAYLAVHGSQPTTAGPWDCPFCGHHWPAKEEDA
jgi:hypothetical protein